MCCPRSCPRSDSQLGLEPALTGLTLEPEWFPLGCRNQKAVIHPLVQHSLTERLLCGRLWAKRWNAVGNKTGQMYIFREFTSLWKSPAANK